MNEVIRTFWRFGYIRLFDSLGRPTKDKHISTDRGETGWYDWRRIIWRFYWRES